MKKLKIILDRKSSGQTMTILLVFVAMATMIIIAAVMISITNTTTTSQANQGEASYLAAESGIENAIINILRNPNYSGETIEVGNYGNAIITVTGSTTITILSTGIVGDFRRTIQVTGTIDSENVFVKTSWIEI